MPLKKLLFGSKPKKSTKSDENSAEVQNQIQSEIPSIQITPELLSAIIVEDYYQNRLKVIFEMINTSLITNSGFDSLNMDVSDARKVDKIREVLLKKRNYFKQLYGIESNEENTSNSMAFNGLLDVLRLSTRNQFVSENQNKLNQKLRNESIRSNQSMSESCLQLSQQKTGLESRVEGYRIQDMSQIERECKQVLNDALRALSLEDISKPESYHTIIPLDSQESDQYYTPGEYNSPKARTESENQFYH